MTKNRWKRKIKKACTEAETYKPFFDSAIDALAGILEQRDVARTQIEVGEEPIVIETTTAQGNTNYVKNPVYVMLNDLEKTALAYWKELGLTPAGLKKLREESFTQKKDAAGGNSLLRLLEESKQSKTV